MSSESSFQKMETKNVCTKFDLVSSIQRKVAKNNLFALEEIALYLYPIIQSDTFSKIIELRIHSV